jgi:hypothetical protein
VNTNDGCGWIQTIRPNYISIDNTENRNSIDYNVIIIPSIRFQSTYYLDRLIKKEGGSLNFVFQSRQELYQRQINWKMQLRVYVIQWAQLIGITDYGINLLIQFDKSQISLSSLMYVKANLHIIMSRLLESVCLCHKLTPLNCFRCIILCVF